MYMVPQMTATNVQVASAYHNPMAMQPMSIPGLSSMPVAYQVAMPMNVSPLPQFSTPQFSNPVMNGMGSPYMVVSAPVIPAQVAPVAAIVAPEPELVAKVVPDVIQDVRMVTAADVRIVSEEPSPKSGSEAADTGSDPKPAADGELFVTMIELRHGRKRALTVNKCLQGGTRVIVHNSRGKEIGTVLAQTALLPSADGSAPRIKEVERVDEQLFREFEAECEREECYALRLARKVAVQMKLMNLNIHCATMQYQRSRFVLHYTSGKDCPEFRKFIKQMRTKLVCTVWLNNCAPDAGSAGEALDPRYYG
eukprot:Hpha_TRINITY_DN15908_c10_g2::TRINITY_DN15908_c10_g2_i1::g.71486::m.71486